MIASGLAALGCFYSSLHTHSTWGDWLELGVGGSPPAILIIIAVASAEEISFRGYLQTLIWETHLLIFRVLFTGVAMAFYKNLIHLRERMPFGARWELLALEVPHNMLPSSWME